MSKGRSAPRWRGVRILALVLSVAASGLAAASAALPAAPASADNNNSLGATPLMGWSNWSYIGNDPTTAKIEAQAAAMKSSGLLAAGYQYINVDDFYYLCNSNGPEVDANGRWATDPGKFPNAGSTPGMAAPTAAPEATTEASRKKSCWYSRARRESCSSNRAFK